MSVSRGQSNGLVNDRSKHRAQKELSVRVPHRATATCHAGVLCLSAEVRATSPTLLNKMPHSLVHRKSKVQSDNLMSCPPISSHDNLQFQATFTYLPLYLISAALQSLPTHTHLFSCVIYLQHFSVSDFLFVPNHIHSTSAATPVCHLMSASPYRSFNQFNS